MLRDIVDHSLVVFFVSMRVLNPRYELDRSNGDHALSYKRVRQMKRYIFGILVSKNDNIQVRYNHMVVGNLSRNKPNERGVRRIPTYDPNANAYDGIA